MLLSVSVFLEQGGLLVMIRANGAPKGIVRMQMIGYPWIEFRRRARQKEQGRFGNLIFQKRSVGGNGSCTTPKKIRRGQESCLGDGFIPTRLCPRVVHARIRPSLESRA